MSTDSNKVISGSYLCPTGYCCQKDKCLISGNSKELCATGLFSHTVSNDLELLDLLCSGREQSSSLCGKCSKGKTASAVFSRSCCECESSNPGVIIGTIVSALILTSAGMIQKSFEF